MARIAEVLAYAKSNDLTLENAVGEISYETQACLSTLENNHKLKDKAYARAVLDLLERQARDVRTLLSAVDGRVRKP